jgi:hypothetical protein
MSSQLLEGGSHGARQAMMPKLLYFKLFSQLQALG